MKKILFLLVATMLLGSCNRKYQYVETVKEKQLIGSGYDLKEKEAKVFSAASDSDAYLNAYKLFCISNKVYRDMLESGYSDATVPHSFKLYNANGEDITYISFTTKEEKEAEIAEMIGGMENSLKKAQSKGNKLGDWQIDNYVDEFDEKTGERYIHQTSLGTFSNSATTNSDLLAHILIDKKQIRFRLQEYARNYVKSDESMRLRVKAANGDVNDFHMYINRDGYITSSYWHEENDSLRSILLRGGEVKFYGVVDHYSKSTYNFAFNVDGLQYALEELDKPQDTTGENASE